MGIFDGHHFRDIKCRDKTSVDIDHAAEFKMSTDEFFAQIQPNKVFDIIYIDANHNYDYVLRDFNNSVKHLNKKGLLFVHDMIPPNEEHTKEYYCGDAFKLLYFIQHHTDIEWYSMRTDYGLTLFINPECLLPDDNIKYISYSDFMNHLDLKRVIQPLDIMEKAKGVIT